MKQLLLIIGAIAIMPCLSHAHRMDIDCYIQGNTLVIEAWVGKDDAVIDGEVSITNSEGAVLTTGTTNKQGRFSWQPQTMQDITITIYAGEGHKKKLEISQAELTELFKTTNLNSPIVDATSAVSTNTLSKPGASSKRSISTKNAFGAPERITIALSFLAALTAAWLSYRNNKTLKEIKKALQNNESRD
jgi:hypothetical protein